jgi:translocator protein
MFCIFCTNYLICSALTLLIVIDYFKLIVSIGGCLLVGGISGLWTAKSISSWYKKLRKPSFNPPNWIFGPVWSILYILMGIALYLVWISAGPGIAMILFGIQLLINFLWSFFFFSMKKTLIAFIDILLLLAMIILTALQFYPISRIAAILFVPYILWVCFAAVLNFKIYSLNK